MRTTSRILLPLVLAAAVTSPLFVTGCAVRARVYDPYYHDYHYWDAENTYYLQWENQTHRSHMDFNNRSQSDQKAYWDWRHHQENHH